MYMFGRKPVKATQFLEEANVFFFHYQPAKIIGFQQVNFFGGTTLQEAF